MSGLYTTFPSPLVTALTKPFWDGCAEGKIRLQQCTQCGRFRFYPTEACPDCRSTEYAWIDTSGKGRIFSWIVVHRSVDPVWQSRAPFVTGIVEIDEQPGCFIPGIIVDVDPKQVREGMPVVVQFERTDESTVVPRWRVT